MVATGGAMAGVKAGILAAHGTNDSASFIVTNSSGSFGKADKYRESALRNCEQEKIARMSGLRSQGISLGMGAMNIARTVGQKATAYNTPDAMHIQNNSAILQGIQNRIGYTIYHMGITAEMAQIIDSYFEMFGYATHKLKVPNFVNGGRRFWDYIKMESAQINPQTGAHGINAEAQQAIQEIFNNGITLWTNLSDVGKYNLNNHGA
jgi:phosphate/sulfate permease